MFLSYNWLREISGTSLSPQEVRARLTNVGLAIDAMVERDGDFVLDAEVPSNRPDCLSHFGIARELAVIEKSIVQSPRFKVPNGEGKSADFTAVKIQDADLCPRYAARVVRGVRIGPSPDWLGKRLAVIGQRPINNVADVTNYVLHELGHPLHAFDLAKLAEGRIVVRRPRPGELITTLDGVKRQLDREMLVIADAERPVAVAGVMGGEDSEISAATHDVLIESAYFDPASIRRTAKLLGLHTEASHRFERGADPEGVLRAQERCVALICEIAGGTATQDAVDVYPRPLQSRIVTLRPERVTTLTGLTVETGEILRILMALGFVPLQAAAAGAGIRGAPGGSAGRAKPATLVFTVPSWRHDVGIEEDLIEEIARHLGYDKISTELAPSSLAGEYHSNELRKRALRGALSAGGFDEAVSSSFIDTAHEDEFELIPAFQKDGPRFVELENPIIEDWKSMRPTLLPGLLNAVRHNLNRGTRDVCLFELGRIFVARREGELPDERESLALVATGGVIEADRAGASRELDFYDLKGALEAAVAALNVPPLAFKAQRIKHLRAGQAAAINLDSAPIGSIGRLAETIAAEYKFRQPVFTAEVDLTALLELPQIPVLYSPLPRFPAVVRDVSLLLDCRVTVAELLRAVNERRVGNCQGAMFVGTYEGPNLPEGKRSVTLRLEYRAADHTLRDEEVDEIHWPLVKSLQAKFAAEIR